MTYRDDLAALSARHDALSTEVAHKTRELENATRLLDEARAKARLPVLDNIRVATPCSASWANMTGDERVRHCGDCKKNVYNLSDMTRDEAEALIIAKEGKLCVRYYQRKDGTILLKDCEIGVSRRRRRKWIAASTAALLATGGAAVAMRVQDKPAHHEDKYEIAGGLGPMEELPPQHHEVKMGEMVAPPPPVQHHEVKGRMAVPHDLLAPLNKTR